MYNFNRILPEATLVKRINRFVAEVILNKKKLLVYVPNTGRLSELALPGTEVILSPIDSKYEYKILYIINKLFPVMIDSTYSNRLFHELLKNKKVPGLENSGLIRREPVYENHRFDFLLSTDNESRYIELKSCTLFYKDTASFPDAVSTRASEHVKALTETGNGTLIFLVLHSGMMRFVPNYHTDFIFYETLKHYKERIKIFAYTVQYDKNLKIRNLKKIPVIIPEVKPCGIYLLILNNSSDSVYGKGEILKQGYYLYCGKENVNIFKTISSIKRKNGLSSILPEVISSKLKIISDIPIITDIISPKELKKKLIKSNGADFPVPDQKEYDEETNLIYFKDNPLEESWFWDLVLEMRFGCTQHKKL